MSENIPSSPVPGNTIAATTTENTRLLDTSAATYNSQDSSSTTRQERTIITMTSSSDHHESSSSTNSHFLNGGGVTSSRHYHKIISAGQPTIPTHQLTEKIQDILVFTEIKKNQQERVLLEEKKKKNKDQEVPAQYSSSDSESDDDTDGVRLALKKKLSEFSIGGGNKKSVDGSEGDGGKRLRKRDFAVDALRFATDKWKIKHGYATGGSSSSLFSGNKNQDTATTTTTTAITTALMNNGNANSHGAATTVIQQQKRQDQQFKTIPSSAQNVFDVAKNASVCAILALLHERRQSSGHSAETDISLQALALSTLNLGLKVHDTSASQVVLYDMLTNKWMHGKSALEWAVENNSELILNDTRVQVVIDELWNSGPNWRQDPNHPSNIWLAHPPSSTSNGNGVNKPQHQVEEEPKNFTWFVINRTFVDFLARWPSARYQALIALFSGLVYLGFHLATITNLDYTSDNPYLYEYIYYLFVISDVLLEFYKLWTQPFVYLKKISSYINFIAASLLLTAFIIRFVALIAVDSIEEEFYFISFSFNLLILATPLMFFRVFAASTDLCWSTAKTAYILHQCFTNSIWVFSAGFFVLLGFWVALGALQFGDVNPFAMLQFLVLGALHAPEIGGTLLYQPEIAGLLLSVYLFLTVVVLGALLTASFLSTILQIYGCIDTVKRDWVINRCLRSNPILNAFIPSIAVDLIFGFFNWISRVIFKRQSRVVWLEKVHQVLWYIIYSPIILLVGLYELVTLVLFRWKLVVSAFKRKPVVAASTAGA